MKTALGLLEFNSELSASASTRKVWVFPVLSGANGVRYRVDEAAGLVRYYLRDGTKRSFSAASTAASERILFGKKGYLGVPLSGDKKPIYVGLQYLRVGVPRLSIHLAISDSDTEGEWLITAGPRKGELFWDHANNRYGHGARGSGWSGRSDFWSGSNPDGGSGENYAGINSSGSFVDQDGRSDMGSISHHDFWLSRGGILARLVEVEESPPNPVLRVDFSKFQATPLILTEDQISVDDPDTRYSADNTKVDASRIKFRIMEIVGGTLRSRTDTPSTWTEIPLRGTAGNQYREFTLTELRGGLIAFFPNAGASMLTFKIQAADDDSHLSDSDPYDDENDADPVSVSIPLVVLKKVAVGKEVAINDDGVLTPDDDTLDAWLTADNTLRILVILQRGKSGIVRPGAGVVQERLSLGLHGVARSKIAVSWEAKHGRLVLEGTASAMRADFQAMLGTLRLRTVPFGQVSTRTILVQPDVSAPVVRATHYRRDVQVDASTNPILEVGFDKSRVNSRRHFLLREEHMSVYDPDTQDASNVWLRITGLTGGELQRRSSSSASDWTDIDFTPGTQYQAFTLEDLRAGKIAFLAGDGLASGEGTKVVFQVQAADAADDTANLSDSDPNDGQSDADPVDADILVVPTVETTAGYVRLLNADGVLTPDDALLVTWKQSAEAHNGILHVIVKLSNRQTGDVLSLRSGYDASKVRPRWDESTGELSIEFDGAATISEMKTALALLEFDSELSVSANTRKVWVFPILPGVGNLRYRLDEAAGLVRYYLYDSASRSFSDASAEASGRILFGKYGYLGVHTSDAEKAIYQALRTKDMHLAISDDTQAGTTEGKWVITSGPRKGQVLWNHAASPQAYGPGASGSGWSTRGQFWTGSEPDNSGSGGEDYAKMDSNGLAWDVDDGSRSSISHHDLRLSAGGIFSRPVEVAESPVSPVLRVDFSKLQATSQRRVVLREDHIRVDDVDTRDPSDSTKIDASRIKFRITEIAGGTLQRRADAAGVWMRIPLSGTSGSRYQEFTLTQLQDGLVSLFPDDAGVPALTFEIQADDGTHLSDSDPHDDESDADPTSVSVSVVALKEIYAGKEMPVNDDTGLTPDDITLNVWISAATSDPRVLVKLEGGRRGDVLFLEDGHGAASIASSWSWDEDTAIGVLYLQSDGGATADDFQTLLNALKLRTVRSVSASVRTISVRPDVAEEVEKKDYYTRDILVRKSGPRPYVGVQEVLHLKFGQDDRAILSSSEFLVEDFDSSASDVMIVMRNLVSGAELQKRNAISGSYDPITLPSGSLEFSLEDMQKGLIAIHFANPVGRTITFGLEARDGNGNWNDVGKSNSKSNTDQRGVRAFSLTGVLALSPEELETDLETGHQKAVPFGGLERMIETVRSSSSRDGALHIVLKHAVSGDRLSMRNSVSGVTGAWAEGGHRYTLTVSNGATTSAQIDAALAQVYYRARESATEERRELVVSWIDNTGAETVLFTTPLANRPPVLRNWGMAARYHDITPASGATEAPLDLGYHPYREYMPEILDNEGKAVRLEVVLMDKAGGVLSADERVFLSQQLLDLVQMEGLVLRELRSSDNKARALVIEFVDGRTPEFLTRILQGLSYRHGAAGRDGDVGERRRISVAVFDGDAYSQRRTMEVRLVDTVPNPAGYVNTFIGTAKHSGMGVSRGTGNQDNEAGMTFPGAAYPFGAVRLTPEIGEPLAYGGYRHDKSLGNVQFVVTAFSGPGCHASEGGGFVVGVGGSEAKSVDKDSQESEAGYYKALLSKGGDEVVLEAAASSPRTTTMRLTYESDGLTGFISLPGWLRFRVRTDSPVAIRLSEKTDRWVVTYDTLEGSVCRDSTSIFYVAMHIGKHQVSSVSQNGSKIEFALRSGQRAVDVKISMSYVSRESASRNIDVENPVWSAFEVEKEKARKAWNYYLSKVTIDEFQDSGHDKTDDLDKWSIFYSALYRSMLHMNTASDVDGNYMGDNDRKEAKSERRSQLWILERCRHGGASPQGVLLQLFGLGRVPFTDGSGWFDGSGLEPGYGHQFAGECLWIWYMELRRQGNSALDDGLSRNRCDAGRFWSCCGFLAVDVRESERISKQHSGGF